MRWGREIKGGGEDYNKKERKGKKEEGEERTKEIEN